jgi:hypothetical protein
MLLERWYSIYTPWVCEQKHELEIDGVDSKGRCRLCNSLVKVCTTPEEAREAIALDRFKPVKTKLLRGRYHKVETKECLFCHTFFETTFVNSRYCGKKCKNGQSRDRDKHRRLGVIHCMFCGVEVSSVDKRRKFCGSDCRENMRKA